jgi:phospholipid-translocating ATPase
VAKFILLRSLILLVMQAIFSSIFDFVDIPIYNYYLLAGFASLFSCFPVFSILFDDLLD